MSKRRSALSTSPSIEEHRSARTSPIALTMPWPSGTVCFRRRSFSAPSTARVFRTVRHGAGSGRRRTWRCPGQANGSRQANAERQALHNLRVVSFGSWPRSIRRRRSSWKHRIRCAGPAAIHEGYEQLRQLRQAREAKDPAAIAAARSSPWRRTCRTSSASRTAVLLRTSGHQGVCHERVSISAQLARRFTKNYGWMTHELAARWRRVPFSRRCRLHDGNGEAGASSLDA